MTLNIIFSVATLIFWNPGPPTNLRLLLLKPIITPPVTGAWKLKSAFVNAWKSSSPCLVGHQNVVGWRLVLIYMRTPPTLYSLESSWGAAWLETYPTTLGPGASVNTSMCIAMYVGPHTLHDGPSVSKSNRLHVVSFWFFFIKLRYILLHIPLKWWVIFMKSWTSTSYFSNLTGSSVASRRFSPLVRIETMAEGRWKGGRTW